MIFTHISDGFYINNWFINHLYELLKIIFYVLVSFTNPTWQQVVILLAILILVIFIKEIKFFISRHTLESVKCGNTELQFTKQGNPKEPLPFNENFIHNENLSPTLKKYMDGLNEHLRGKGFDSLDKQTKYLERLLVYNTYILVCERIYATIFGGQIQILKELDSGKSIGDDFINRRILQNKKQNPEMFEKWDVNMYMRYLLNADLVIFSNTKYNITQFGKDFLNWMRQHGVSENKPY